MIRQVSMLASVEPVELEYAGEGLRLTKGFIVLDYPYSLALRSNPDTAKAAIIPEYRYFVYMSNKVQLVREDP